MDIEEIKEKANNGSAVSQGILGHIYLWGNGVSPDYDEAFKWLKVASEKGISQSIFNLGYMYEHGLGVNKDDLTAIGYYEKAAKGGHLDAILALGCYYFEGQNEDKQKSEKWFKAALKNGGGDPARIAYKFKESYGLPKNNIYSILWYNIAKIRSLESIKELESKMKKSELREVEELLKIIK